MVGLGQHRQGKFWDFIGSRLAKIASSKVNFKELEMKWSEIGIFSSYKDYPTKKIHGYGTVMTWASVYFIIEFSRHRRIY